MPLLALAAMALGAFAFRLSPLERNTSVAAAGGGYALAAIGAALFVRIFTLIARGQSLIIRRGLDRAAVFE